MNVNVEKKTAEEAVAVNVKEAGKESKGALMGIKKGAVAAKRAASKISSAPAKIFDKAVYGACYGISYGAVFSSLMVAKLVPANTVAFKGFHDGANVARKDFKAHEEKLAKAEKSVVSG